ncbi:MAG: cytochrome c4 [Gammaproteobacteria bacterium]|nr:cytochrome c4 [Gammaproteobacteria bacterium]
MILTALLLSSAALSAADKPLLGDAQAGQSKAQLCVACHGADGNSVSPLFPKLAGQHAKYLSEQLHAFKLGAQGPRHSPNAAQMYGMAAGLSDQDIADIAAYYASQKVTVGTTAQSVLALGQALYRGGDTSKGVAACAACHGPNGRGNPQAGYPQVSGQHAAYTNGQLQAFATAQRSTDTNEVMRALAIKLSPADMEAVAEYIQGLH